MGDRLQYEQFGNNKLWFLYDADGLPAGLRYDDGTTATYYYYVCNWRGDVVALYSDTALVCKYDYDAWGSVTSVKNADGTSITLSTHIANINPIRYRGYYYDYESGLYYINSRYYDPGIRRFISADDESTVSGATITDNNLFAYCDNNPVTREDYDGDFWHIVVGAVVNGGLEFISSLATGDDIQDALIAAGFGVTSGALCAAFPAASFGINIGFSAVESVTIDVKNKETTPTIISNAIVSVGFAAISGNEGSSYTKKATNQKVKSISKAVSQVKKGNHPAIKKAAKKSLKKMGKSTLKSARNKKFQSISMSAIGKGVQKFFKMINKIWRQYK